MWFSSWSWNPEPGLYPQVEEFKYLSVLITSEGKVER